jgi:hypothetical protein
MIVGFNVTSVKAHSEESRESASEIKINSTPSVLDVEEVKVAEMKDVVRVKFAFTTKYEPKIGEINIEGALLWRGEKYKDVLRLWKDGKKLESGAAIEILNAIFRRCLTRVISLAEELRLPPPLQFPKVVAGKPAEPVKAA